MKSKMKKKVKGMTLIEVIVALAIFVVMTLMMVQVGAVTKALMMQTNHLNRKTAAEGPIASVQDVNALTELAAGLVDDEGNALEVSATPVTFTISANGSSKTSVINTVKYSSQAAGEAADPNFDANMRGHLEFYVVETPPEAPGT
ncbi:MAG: prepilin-type N-terminal cleavage/methylation domain-containing protein [Oscillospiraceae bacterium]|nr:prepilin-type N-terminal cleavage/methylation domain-containing protein [Oscillospiraceae bacterium]